MLLAILQHADFATADLASLTKVCCAGAPVPVYLMEQVKERIGADVAIGFGQTETSPAITLTLPDDPFEPRATTVGVPLPHTELKLSLPATGEIVPCQEHADSSSYRYPIMP